MGSTIRQVVSDHPRVFGIVNKNISEEEAIKLVANVESKGSELQRVAFDLQNGYHAVCNLTALGFRKYACPYAEKLFIKLLNYQLHIQAYDISSRLEYHHSLFGSFQKAEFYENHGKNLIKTINLERKAKSYYNTVSRKKQLGLPIDINKIVRLVEGLKSKLPMDSLTYHSYYYRLKAMTLKGKALEMLYLDAISYYDTLYFKHTTIRGIFVRAIIGYYKEAGSTELATTILEQHLKKLHTGSGPWFVFMFELVDIYSSEGQKTKAIKTAELAMDHPNYKAQPTDYIIEWTAIYEKLVAFCLEIK